MFVTEYWNNNWQAIADLALLFWLLRGGMGRSSDGEYHGTTRNISRQNRRNIHNVVFVGTLVFEGRSAVWTMPIQTNLNRSVNLLRGFSESRFVANLPP